MAKFMYIGSYAAQGAKGLMQQGGSARRRAAEEVIGSVGGKVESFYFGFGKDDVYVTFDVPSAAAAAAVALTVGASGSIGGRTVALISAEEMDDAAKLHPTYSPPGS